MASSSFQVELLSPAKNIDIAMQAILHGADAVYIGGPQFGARYQASNSIKDIAVLVAFAHRYYAKVYVTFNTILHDDELSMAQQLIYQLYDCGVDALIIQDMGILMLDIPPIQLHASTQMDIRSEEKAKFLSQVGFSQIVLARELNLKQIKKISNETDAAIEFFVHGALCVSYSGQCYLSYATKGRSANRGECSQACRLPYSLKTPEGEIIADQQYLLSLKDNNQSENIEALLDAGVRSFKIEGRYKDLNYVKNITAHYRQLIDRVLLLRTEFKPASSGRINHTFTPAPEKTFNRGSTDYFFSGRQANVGAFNAPGYVGSEIGHIVKVSPSVIEIESKETLHNGDGLSVFKELEIFGFRANKVDKLSGNRFRVMLNEHHKVLDKLPLPFAVNRNLDHEFNRELLKETSYRAIKLDFTLGGNLQVISLSATSEEGVNVALKRVGPFNAAEQGDKMSQQMVQNLKKLGQSIYYCDEVKTEFDEIPFLTRAQLNQFRRDVIEQLTEKRLQNYKRPTKKYPQTPLPAYPQTQLSYLANVYNQQARKFYELCGVLHIEPAFEMNQEKSDVALMTTKYCLRYACGLCPSQIKKQTGKNTRATPLHLQQGKDTFLLTFNCKACEMQVRGKIKSSISNLTLLGSLAASLLHEIKTNIEESHYGKS